MCMYVLQSVSLKYIVYVFLSWLGLVGLRRGGGGLRQERPGLVPVLSPPSHHAPPLPSSPNHSKPLKNTNLYANY